jgi:metal-responsive CopG/Arc/MetJ family transcriptional regulator
MPSVKTAVSIDEKLFEEADALAEEMDVSRSRLFSMALEQFLRRQRSRRLLQQMNAAVDGAPTTPEEIALRTASRRRYRRIVEGEW